MIISIDFDGTIVENAYPEIGEPKTGVKSALRYLKSKGHTIIINSCRAGIYADNMIKWLRRHDFAFDFVNENDPKRTSQYGGDTRKISADIYIDDKNIFCKDISWFAILQEIERLVYEEEKKKTRICLYDLFACLDSISSKTIDREELEQIIKECEI